MWLSRAKGPSSGRAVNLFAIGKADVFLVGSLATSTVTPPGIKTPVEIYIQYHRPDPQA